MRLTHLKLAGFKSFVDPTTLHIHGQRVGVVGPNGCGKSNVMESVRWVLGESSAKEMRGDSMDAVIFNGSGNRKPISRASVELIFDNSLGGANGEWSQYAEISVKRVIERDKGSSYYINNTSVRRRDVADLFLGTGLGGRAYAIIGQNTISRIVEAKPEELRIFLEEAAGISKYKERRRETELRLRDTRENLTRIEDIRREMDKQITRLESQALVTEQYHRLQDALKQAQGQLWLLKKRDASTSWEKSQRQVEKLVNELEAQMAALRKTESLLESLRQQNYTSTEAVQTAQTNYYETNADVSNLENQVKHTQEARERLTAQLQQIAAQMQKAESQAILLQETLQQLTQQQQEAGESETESTLQLQQTKAALPEAEHAHGVAQQSHAEAQRALTEAEQNIRLESTNLEHLGRTITEINQRLQRLANEQGNLQLPAEAELQQKQSQFDQAKAEVAKLEASMADLRAQEQQHTDQVKLLREARLNDERRLAQINAQIASLTKIQESLGHESKLDAWLKHSGLDQQARLWQKLNIADGWETALEAVLGARLNAVLESKGFKASQDRPPSALVVCWPGQAGDKAATNTHLQAMSSIVHVSEPSLSALLEDWLAAVYLLDDSADTEAKMLKLKNGEVLVNRLGDIYTRHSISFHAAQSALHGVLERQRELASLQKQLPKLNEQLTKRVDELQQAELAIQQIQSTQQEQQQSLRSNTQSQHQLTLEIQRLQQQRQHVLDRQQALQTEQANLQLRAQGLQADQLQKQTSLETIRGSLAALQSRREQVLSERQRTETALNAVRDSLQKVERLAQEKQFNLKLISNNINEINNKINAVTEEKQALLIRQKEAETQLDAARMESLKANLEAALSLKQIREAELAAARNAMSVAEQELQAQERNRMQNEQMLHPLRDKLEQARLQEQQARLYFEQCQQALIATGLDEAKLAEHLAPSAKAADLERSTTTLSAQIEELGPVNLAAIQELASERERKAYLDSQALDLEQAIATLEDAIRRIDKETRTRLQHTFDEANKHFGELFTTLFGGGQAKLELLGEEILDTGMQVFAQPPGKKNSTIHLLSGGEKALTALALVFALFKLNPAPFCLMDEVDAPLDDSNTERFCNMVRKMSERTQFLFVSHNKITMEMAQQLVGVTMQESGVSRIVEVDIEAALQMHQEVLV
ncbi:MAG TPA: chromosome segregation protein SMC [Methylophilaceae bacterium]|nr:chromosome segregation protein SMC [Methylophilaceae bacterium]